MSPWKAALGVGAACAACCALPVLGLAGGAAASGALSGALSAAWLDAPWWVGVIVSSLVLTVGAGWFWQRRRAQRAAACDCADSCSATPHSPCG